MTAAHAEALLPLAHDEPRLHAIARRASKESWTRDRIRQEIDRKPRINEGAKGARAVREAGGIVVVQSPDSAEARMMPESALTACPKARAMNLHTLAELLCACGGTVQC